MKWGLVIFVAGFATKVVAQGTFQNLSFQCANLPSIPAGQYGGLVSIADALPGWSGFVDGQSVTQVLQNNLQLGNASIDVLSADWDGNPPLVGGGYTLVLQSGNEGPPFGGQNLGGSEISQSGTLPANAQSIEFEADIVTPSTIALNGVALTLVPLQTGLYYTLYGANIFPSDIGKNVDLSISTYGTPGANYFGPLEFSPASVPEPDALWLTPAGAIAFGIYRMARRKMPRALM